MEKFFREEFSSLDEIETWEHANILPGNQAIYVVWIPEGEAPKFWWLENRDYAERWIQEFIDPDEQHNEDFEEVGCLGELIQHHLAGPEDKWAFFVEAALYTDEGEEAVRRWVKKNFKINLAEVEMEQHGRHYD